MKMTFYDRLIPMTNFEDINDASFFTSPPEDWYVVISDIRGSTKAVKEGRYKDVNLIGVSIITLVSNFTKKYNTISVFGGDGATLLVSKEEFESLRDEMCGLIRLAKNKFNIELRIGAVSVLTLKQNQKQLLVGKYQVSATTYLAQLMGGGVQFAEDLIKKMDSRAIVLNSNDGNSAPNLTGLSCRMSHFPNSKGSILSLIIKSQFEDSNDWVRSTLIAELKAILENDFTSSNPIKKKNLQWKWIPATLSSEIKLLAIHPFDFFKITAKALIANFMIKLNIAAGGFIPKKYKNEIPMQSDFQKYDDTLRLVIDCSADQVNQIEQFLKKAYLAGKIFYGTFESKFAVVTCMTKTASLGEHIHYVDGEGGGYSMASVQLKEQIRLKLERMTS